MTPVDAKANDDAYANMPYIPGAEAYPSRWQAAATDWATRQAAHGRYQGDISYGDRPREKFDLFIPEGTPLGLLVFVHGGYWLKFDRSYWLHFSKGALANGWAVAMPSYDLCPEVRVSDITQQISRAVMCMAEQIDGPIILAGHSAGGHLVARMLEPGLLTPSVAARLRRVMPISPVSDLRPLLLTSMNADFRLTKDSAAAESPVLMTQRLDVPVTVWVGADERPVFLDQARWLAEAWHCPVIVDEGKHHFDVIDGLMDPDSPLIDALFA